MVPSNFSDLSILSKHPGVTTCDVRSVRLSTSVRRVSSVATFFPLDIRGAPANLPARFMTEITKPRPDQPLHHSRPSVALDSAGSHIHRWRFHTVPHIPSSVSDWGNDREGRRTVAGRDWSFAVLGIDDVALLKRVGGVGSEGGRKRGRAGVRGEAGERGRCGGRAGCSEACGRHVVVWTGATEILVHH